MNILSRQIFDNATFYFRGDETEISGSSVSCLGSDGEIVEKAIRQDQIEKLLESLEELILSNYKKNIKIKLQSVNVNLKFSGSKKDKGIKVRAYLTGFFFYSSAGFGSYTTEDNVNRLMVNLRKRLAQLAI
jgi:hypothetical protein